MGCWIVFNGRASLKICSSPGQIFRHLHRKFLSLKHGVETLNRADADPCRGIEGIGSQALDNKFLAELEVVVWRNILLEFFECLLSEVTSIHQKKHTLCTCKLDQAVDEVNGGKGLPLPVAIWMSARGRLSVRDFSRFLMA